jgi:hypothetical protein
MMSREGRVRRRGRRSTNVTKELYRNDFGTIIHHPEQGILELEWLEGSASMTDDDFMRSMERYAAFAEEHRTPNMLVDVTKFRHSPGDHVAPWRDEHIIPRYNAAGVTKFAFLVPPGGPGTVEAGSQPEREPPGSFPTGYFEDRQHIFDWFVP